MDPDPDPYWPPISSSGSGSGSVKNEYGSTTLTFLLGLRGYLEIFWEPVSELDLWMDGMVTSLFCRIDCRGRVSERTGRANAHGLLIFTVLIPYCVGDPHVFGPPGSGSIIQRYGSGPDPSLFSFPFLIRC